MAITTVHESEMKTCGCGRRFAELQSQRTGRPYAVNIGERIGAGLFKIASNDFHNCESRRRASTVELPGIAAFLATTERASGGSAVRIRLVAGTQPVVIKSNPAKGLAYVTDGGAYGESLYFGSISLDGGFRPGRDLTPAVTELLTIVNGNPLAAAVAYGKAVGCCSFCSRDLDDERSLSVGYGPTCAKRLGLPWGEQGETSKKRAKRTVKAAAEPVTPAPADAEAERSSSLATVEAEITALVAAGDFEAASRRFDAWKALHPTA